jgi:hypothetical protein
VDHIVFHLLDGKQRNPYYNIDSKKLYAALPHGAGLATPPRWAMHVPLPSWCRTCDTTQVGDTCPTGRQSWAGKEMALIQRAMCHRNVGTLRAVARCWYCGAILDLQHAGAWWPGTAAQGLCPMPPNPSLCMHRYLFFSPSSHEQI